MNKIKDLGKLNFLLDKKQINKLILLSVLLFFAMILELIGLGTIIPLTQIILFPENSIGFYDTQIFGFVLKDLENINTIIISLFFFIYFFKIFFLTYLTFRQNKFLTNLKATMTNNLFGLYLNQDYTFHVNENSSRLYNNIQLETNHINLYINALIQIIVEASMIFSSIFILILIEPIGAILVGIFIFICTISFYAIFKRKLYVWGNKRANYDKDFSKTLMEGLNGIRDYIIYDKLRELKNKFNLLSYSRSQVESNHLTINQIPRFYLELISIIGISGFLFILFLQGKNNIEIITISSVFLAAIFRVIPSFNRILSSSQNLKYFKPSLELIYNEFKSNNIGKDISDNKIFKFKNEIKIEKLKFKYLKSNEYVLNSINLTIQKGQTIGIMGQSGSGKSTLTSLILGLIKPLDGKILVDNRDIHQNLRGWQKNIGYVPQNIFLTDSTIEENIAFGIEKNKIDRDLLDYALKSSQLDQFVNSLSNKEKTKVGERGVQLSGGQIQRIGIARALYKKPNLIILDEATSSLDKKTESNFMNSVYNELNGLTKIIISHNIETLNNCDIVYYILNGKLIEK